MKKPCIRKLAFPAERPPEVQPDWTVRDTFPQSDEDGSFEGTAMRTLRSSLPLDFVERFAWHRDRVERQLVRGIPDVLVGEYFRDFAERLWIAEACEQGSRLVITQHGGRYGEARDALWEVPETRVADCFVTWGWDVESKTATGLPAPRLMDLDPVSGEGEDLLIVLGTRSRYPTYGNIRGLGDVQKFLGGIGPSLRDRTVVRVRIEKPDVERQRRICEESFPDVRLDWGGASLAHRFGEARLVVIDHFFSTTFLECLAADRPTLVFAPLDRRILTPRARDLYEDLLRLKVFHENHEGAARTVSEVFPSAHEWWNEPARKAVLDRFRGRFARKEHHSIELWTSFLEAQSRLAIVDRHV